MSEKSFIHLLIITFALLIVAIFSILVQPRFETKINKGEVIFQDLNSELNNISRIEIKNGLKEVVIEKNNIGLELSKYNLKKIGETFFVFQT